MTIGSYNVNPSTWSSFGLSVRNKLFDDVMKVFLKQLSDFGLQTQNLIGSLQNPVILAGLLNGTALLQTSAFKHIDVTTLNGTTDCTGATVITASQAISGTSTMTLNNVPDASMFDLRIANVSGLAQTIKVAANKPGGGAYSVLVITGGVISAEVDMTATGFSIPNNNTIYLRGIAQLTRAVIALGYV